MLFTMPRKVIPKEHFSARINSKLFQRLEEFCRRSERSRSEVIDRAVEMFLDQADTVTRTATPPAKPTKPTRP